jgi:hypothetical protein
MRKERGTRISVWFLLQHFGHEPPQLWLAPAGQARLFLKIIPSCKELDGACNGSAVARGTRKLHCCPAPVPQMLEDMQQAMTFQEAFGLTTHAFHVIVLALGLIDDQTRYKASTQATRIQVIDDQVYS